MTSIVTTTPGLYPLPDPAKDTLADLKGHQKHDLISGDESDEITQVYDDARDTIIADQQEAGLDRIVEGQLRWDDMLAHPLTIQDNVDTGGLIRYYDNNNFYRDPIIEGELAATGDIAQDLEAVSAPNRQAVIPGPYTLFDLATDEYYGDPDACLGAIGDFLGDEIAACPSHDTLFILSPSLVTSPPSDDLHDRVVTALDTVASASDADVVVHTYWGALTEQTHAHLLDAQIDALGYDFVTDTQDNLYNITEYGTTDDVALGLLDGQNTRIESPDLIRERIDWFQDQLPAVMDVDTLYVTTNTELFYLPVNKFQAKLDALGTLTQEATAQ